MTIRRARRPLTGPDVADVTVLLGEGRDGVRVVSIRPPSYVRSGVTNLTDPTAVRDLLHDLEKAAAYLEEPSA